MGMLKEFKEFAIKGNAVDMAVGVVIGAAFGKIVSSLVEDMIMPPLGMLIGGRDFSNLFVTLDGSEYDSLSAAKEAGAAFIGYGSFIQTSIDFLIIAFAIFIMVKAINKASASASEEEPETEEVPAEPSEDVLLLREIRDSMAASVSKLALAHTAIEAVAAKIPDSGMVAAPTAGAAEQPVEVETDAESEADEQPDPVEKPKEDDGMGWIDD